MAFGIPFTFSYQRFARYLQGNCDSEQMVKQTLSTENFLHNNIQEYLDAHRRRLKWTFEFTPEEFKTGKGGHPSPLDAAGKSGDRVAMMIEAKLMMDASRSWANEIIEDVLRVSVPRKEAVAKPARVIIVGGRRDCWSRVLPNPTLAVLPLRYKKSAYLDPQHDAVQRVIQSDKVLSRQVMPVRIWVQLVGEAQSGLDDEQEPGKVIDVRIWRTWPEFHA